MDRRKHPRFNIGLPLSFSGHTLTGSAHAVDLSMSGCKVESDRVPQNGDFLEVTLSPPDSDSPLKIDSAVVRWVRGRAFGLEFVYMSDEATSGLDRLIQNLRKQPAKKDLDHPPPRPAPLRPRGQTARKRPKLVWVITIVCVLFAVYTLTAFALLRTEMVPLTPAQEAILDEFGLGDVGWAFLTGAVGLFASIRLFQLRAVAARLFLILLVVQLSNSLWYGYASNGLAYLFSMPRALVGKLAALAVIFVIWYYAHRLKRKGILT